jgi:hypothetical protein
MTQEVEPAPRLKGQGQVQGSKQEQVSEGIDRCQMQRCLLPSFLGAA